LTTISLNLSQVKEKPSSKEKPESASRAVVMLSGGLDSTVAAYIAKSEKYALSAITFCYGQKHDKEIDQAFRIGIELGVTLHDMVSLDIPYSRSSLLNKEEIKPASSPGIPATWVAQRNTIFLALAASYAEQVDAQHIFVGFNAIDYSGYPDCRAEFVQAIQKALNLASKRFVEQRIPIRIHTPLINLTKAQIIQKGSELQVPFHLTWSCYNGGDRACGVCDSCKFRLKGFREAGLEDPIGYERYTNGQ
jgi:7-cyano-7-deazaguanine synthase